MEIDKRISAGEGRGIDVAIQRADDLDNLCLKYIANKKNVTALDVGCGGGGQSIRMAEIGAVVTALDMLDQEQNIMKLANDLNISHIKFIQSNMEEVASIITAKFDVIVCQRAIHYLPYKNACKVIKVFSDLLADSGKIYISASGLYSELSDKYPHKSSLVENRFHTLGTVMANKHDIQQQVCLYSEQDMENLASFAGLKIEKIFTSPFGNIKAVMVNG